MSFLEEFRNKNLPQVTKELVFEEDVFEPDLSQVSGGSLNSREYIYLAPMLQNKQLGVVQEEMFLQELLEYLKKSKIQLSSLYFASAYFNPPFYVWDSLTSLNSKEFKFVTATKEVCFLH